MQNFWFRGNQRITHIKNHHKIQGSQTHPGGPGNAHSRYQLKTQTVELHSHPEKSGSHTAPK